jgi:hypothetical protein
MSFGTALFASVVLILMVYHRGFRKVALMGLGITSVLALLVYASISIYHHWGRPSEMKQINSQEPSWNMVTKEHDIPSCPDNMPIGFVLDGYCVLTGVVVESFRPEMCIGTITENGNCHIKSSRSVLGMPPGADEIQLCPYGLAIISGGKCPAWDTFDRVAAEQKLREFRQRTHQ